MLLKQNRIIPFTLIKVTEGEQMKLIMKTEFDNLRENDNHCYETDTNGEKQVVKIYSGELLIAKKVKLKRSIRYFGIPTYQDYLTQEG